MKKTILKIALCAGMLYSVTSCRGDLLDYNVPGVLSEVDAVTTIGDLDKLMNTVYAMSRSRTESVSTSVFTDEVGIGFANGGQGLSSDYIFQMLPTSSLPSSIWTGGYLALSRVNRVLAFAENIQTNNATEEAELNRIKAEALTMRAYLHLRILAYFTEDMTSDTALAGVLSNKVFSVEEANSNVRVTNGEFYTFIHDDLDTALSLFGTSAVDKTRANKTFAMGLKARAYSYKGDYANAEVWADKVINNSGLHLASLPEYVKIFLTDNEPEDSEVIFRLKRTPQDNSQGSNLHNGWCSITPEYTGSPFYEVSRALFNKLNPSDLRTYMIVAPTSVIDPNYSTSADFLNSDVLVINKHGGSLQSTEKPAAVTQPNGFNNDIKIMRLSEMYFIKAEAQAQSNPAMAATYIHQIKTQRSLDPSTLAPTVFNSPQEAWKGILDEKRIEFAYEGYRFLDLKRLATKAGTGIDRDPADYAQYGGGNPANITMSSHKWALPIPQAELNANSSIQQNPGY